jgi:hypothetical protein
MFWFQAVASFVGWVALGVYAARTQPLWERKTAQLSRGAKVGIASGLMIVCLAILFVPLTFILKVGGFSGGPMSSPVWIVVTLSGLFFVAANTAAMGILVSLARQAAVTDRRSVTSSNEDLDS